ncbi:MAG: hypothetical protein A2504_05610 [Bdellovibrionales bacterium RIFOXYD12_FULL_39_22]|nr:MAG: hypothetical protein A2385_06215 [Bdellovibrionales bacterium RIFOXYB1_FULL_39_21]OFZ41873.1 MAG: hypothetical protein A2485_08185 [Bdellovibrionales bacterium RIFOXYC12_FULL_39_17]OFZ50589.1 MAG: hypothetical protein A2404_05135 [Bdellovibrionales bacterium RIFOXYC1_FULL_39_130]OFZ73513.1 MAG: hypothetical protein A2451_14725 [Bdellovibrionales bacterium RIFOXYC2_FULL_39_8]OFZ77812.1 MAG: hypothetical protein A2560_00305 [Bdellovibrionales bacterium RIFOXYD1_FULL_39_84]OFZ93752.1 MAG:
MKQSKLTTVVSIIFVLLVFSIITGFFPENSTFTINGTEINNPIVNFFGGIVGLIISTVVLFCVGILLLFIFSGLGAIFLSVGLFIIALMATIALPFLLPIIAPLAILFAFLYFQRKKNKNEPSITNAA